MTMLAKMTRLISHSFLNTISHLGVGLDVLCEDDEGHEAAALVVGRHHRQVANLQRGVPRFRVLARRRPVDLQGQKIKEGRDRLTNEAKRKKKQKQRFKEQTGPIKQSSY